MLGIHSLVDDDGGRSLLTVQKGREVFRDDIMVRTLTPELVKSARGKKLGYFHGKGVRGNRQVVEALKET